MKIESLRRRSTTIAMQIFVPYATGSRTDAAVEGRAIIIFGINNIYHTTLHYTTSSSQVKAKVFWLKTGFLEPRVCLAVMHSKASVICWCKRITLTTIMPTTIDRIEVTWGHIGRYLSSSVKVANIRWVATSELTCWTQVNIRVLG